MTMNYKSQSAEAVNSAVAKIFANVSANEVAQKFTKKLIKTKNAQGLKELSAYMEFRVSDNYRVQISAAVFDYGRYIVDVIIEKKYGNRFMEFGRKHYDSENINLISFSQIFADVEAAMYEIVDNDLYLREKWAIESMGLPKEYNYDARIWEELTGLDFAEVVMGLDPMPESEESAEATEEDDDMELAIERLADDIANRADSTMGDYFVDVTHNMWNANDAIDEDRLRELLFDKLDGVAEIDFAEPDDKAILRIWFNRPIKKDAPKLETEDPLTYENVKFFAEQYDIHMGCDGKYVEPRGIAQDNWDEYLTFVENINLEYTKEYWDKFWKIYCNVMCDLWKEEYEVVVDNCYDRLIFTPMIDENDAPCLDDAENVRDYFEKNNDERAFFVLPDYDYVCGLFVEYNEDDDVYVAMGNESWNVTEYDGDTDMSVVIADFSNAWAKEIDEYCDFYKGLDYDRRIYRNDDYDAYMILLNSGVSHGLNVEEGYDPYKGDYVEVIA